ncbi:MAG: hypothetical protein CM1200mP32_12130 [Methanobacteriota archaeon]|nr:MAG: hypothetical protein CM1200mP32_12130 [Euryarchaeota archaeon]
MEPIDEWTVAELKAELKDLGLSNSGNKEELYERLLDAEEEDWGDEEDGFDRSELMASLAGAVVSNRVAIGAVVAVVMLVVAVVVAGPSVLEMIIPAKEAEPEVSVWEFTIEERNQTDIQTFFVNDDATETVILSIPLPRNLSSVYVGGYWGEEDEQPGGIVGCDKVTIEVYDSAVNKSNQYSLSNTDAMSQDCDADKTEPWDKIWYQYTLDLPNITGFEGTQEEALALWEQYDGIGTGEWRIDVTVDVYTLWGTVCDCEDGEEVRLTISYIEYEVKMAKVVPPEPTE